MAQIQCFYGWIFNEITCFQEVTLVNASLFSTKKEPLRNLEK